MNCDLMAALAAGPFLGPVQSTGAHLQSRDEEPVALPSVASYNSCITGHAGWCQLGVQYLEVCRVPHPCFKVLYGLEPG